MAKTRYEICPFDLPHPEVLTSQSKAVIKELIEESWTGEVSRATLTSIVRLAADRARIGTYLEVDKVLKELIASGAVFEETY